MEVNKDEALRCLAISQRYRDTGDFDAARKFCTKSINLFSTPEAFKLLASINAAAEASANSSRPGPSPSSTSSGRQSHTSTSNLKNRQANGTAGGMGGDKREYTPEQLKVVNRVRSCKVEEYYEILEIKKTCEETEIRKAYRKLALALHPDKNGAPGADEAFKMVSRAFQVLSDPQKRTSYDRYGADSASPFSGRSSDFSAAFGNSGTPFEAEITPEELFNMFFGGAGPGPGPFGGQVFTASFGPNVFYTTSRGRRRNTRPEPNAADAGAPKSLFLNFLPLFILFGFSLLSALPNLFSSPSIPDPRFSFVPTTAYNSERFTNNLGIRYHVNPGEFQSHPGIAADLAVAKASAGSIPTKGLRGKAISRFEANVEHAYKQELYSQCQIGLNTKERLKEREIGLFGFGTDWEKIRAIEEEKVASCEELRRLGVIL